MATASVSTRARQIGDPKTRDRLCALIAKHEGDERGTVLANALRKLGYTVDEGDGIRFVHFAERRCRYTTGRLRGTPVHLEPFEFLLGFAFFGCKKDDGTRRFKRVWFEVAKKNGKTFFLAIVLLYCLVALGEEGAEVLNAAASRDQAGMLYKVAAAIAHQDKVLRDQLTISDSLTGPKVMQHQGLRSVFRSISADADYNDGVLPFAVGVDEVHRHKNRGLWDVLRQGQGTVDEPVFWAITTAGAGRIGLAWDEHQHASAVIAGTVDDPSLLAIIYAAPEEADWQDPKTWRMANPALGAFLSEDDLREAVAKAISSPTEEHAIRRLRLNQWVAAETKWIDLLAWDRCGGLLNEHELEGHRFYGGLDISHTTDFSAWCKLFEPLEEGEPWRAVWDFWLPEDVLLKTRPQLAPTLEAWARDGWLTLCPGDLVDHRMVADKIRRDCGAYELVELGYDRWHLMPLISELLDELGDDFMVDVRQGYYLSGACQELERMVLDGRLNHGGNPVMRWMISNAVADVDYEDRIRASKLHSADKIDGVCALLDCLQRVCVAQEESGLSFYVAEEAT